MNGLAQITVDGQALVLKFGLPALRRIFEKMAQYDLLSGEDYNELGLSHILYAGYLNGCAMKDTLATIPYESFYNLVENIEEETIKREVIAAMQVFEDSKYIKLAFGKKKAETPTTENQISTK